MQVFSCSTRLIFGPDALEHLKTLSAKTVLVVTDRFFAENGLAARIAAMIPGAEAVIFDEVQPDPATELVARGAALLQRHRPQVLLALGGGSSLDCAKGILLTAEPRPYFVAIPTTSGTGSEVTSFSILTHGGVKKPLVDPALRPDCAILDDTLLEKLPAGLIADAGMDAVTHCVEAVAAKGRSPVTDALAAEACRTLLTLLPRSYAGDRSVRGQLHLAATMAGIAFDNAGLGVGHALAHALGGRYHVPHGRLGGILLPAVLDCNSRVAAGQYAMLARACGLGAATDLLALRNLRQAVVHLRAALGLPATLREVGVVLDDADAVAEAALADACLQGNPRPVDKNDLKKLLRAVQGP